MKIEDILALDVATVHLIPSEELKDYLESVQEVGLDHLVLSDNQKFAAVVVSGFETMAKPLARKSKVSQAQAQAHTQDNVEIIHGELDGNPPSPALPPGPADFDAESEAKPKASKPTSKKKK